MFKKFLALSSAVFVAAAGFTAAGIASASADNVHDTVINVPGSTSAGYSASMITFGDATGGGSPQYLVAVTWSPALSGGTFAANTTYTAHLVLTASGGNVFNNLAANVFTASGAGSTGVTVTSDAVASGANASTMNVTVAFPSNTPSPVTQSAVTLTAPVIGATPGMQAHNSAVVGAQWMIPGMVTWSPVNSTFQSGTSYSASMDIYLNGNYDLSGLASNFFTVAGASSTSAVYHSTGGGYTTLTVTFPALGSSQQSSQQNSQQNSQQSTIDAAQAAAIAAAKAKAAAQSTLVTSFAANKPVKVTDFAAAGIPVASPTALTRVTADIANLPAAQRTDLAAIAKVVQTENFVDKVATPATHKAVTTVDLVQQGLVDPSNPNKASIVIALQKADPSTLTSLADIQAKIKAAMDAVAARKARTAAIIAKIEGRTATK